MKYYILSEYGLVSLPRSSDQQAFNAAAKPSAVHETDSICPPTRCVAMAPAPNARNHSCENF